MSTRSPAEWPGRGSNRPLAHVALGDIVRLRKPYSPALRTSDHTGPFTFGIVAEILTVLLDGTTRNVSLYLYDPDQRTIYLGPNGIPEFVDFHTSEIELFKRAAEPGYSPLVS
jgi:hypothetical protein